MLHCILPSPSYLIFLQFYIQNAAMPEKDDGKWRMLRVSDKDALVQKDCISYNVLSARC